ncbi:MAG: hypothetical protein GZ085_05640 [Sulfuriferula multivorans]|uniref:Uncharacterized protein n=1 Tax=Sulfuriferula multivorans TaxID=1559896 RepID=A0A7C9P8E9_9PROT|nr:hypothetical protein [Sulfuriferula multivorans]
MRAFSVFDAHYQCIGLSGPSNFDCTVAHVLAQLDLVVGAVHSQFHLSRAKQTTRILNAMDHPHFTMLAHPHFGIARYPHLARIRCT